MRVNINLRSKILEMNGKSLKLEDSLCGAGIDELDDDEIALNLQDPAKPEEESDVYEEMDKIQSTYGERLQDNIQVSATLDENRHYLSLVGKMEAYISRE